MKFRLRRYYLYYLGRILSFVFFLIPIRLGLYIGGTLGILAFHALAEYRRITLENLNHAFGKEKSGQEIAGIAKNVFRNLGRNAAELVNFPKINSSNINRFVTIKNKDLLDSALARGAGVIVLTAHFGNWELLPVTVRLNGYEGAVVGKRIYFDKYDKYLNYLRKIQDINIVYRNQSPKAMLKVLRENKILGMLADQDVDSVDGVFVNFFGRPAYTPIGPVALARTSGASLIPAFIIREEDHHVLNFEKPIELAETGDKDRDIIENTQKWSNVVESFIRRYPDQWVWMHRRWKTRAQ